MSAQRLLCSVSAFAGRNLTSRGNALETYYPLLTLVSVVVFGGLGWFLARKRNANSILWAVIGALLPPLLLIMFFLKPRAAEPEMEQGELDEG